MIHALVAVASLGLVSLAFHPFDWWWLGWFAFVPWMAYHQKAERRGTGRALMLAYYLHYAYVLQWVGEVAPPAVWAIPLLGMPVAWLCAWICDRCVYRLGMSGLVVYPLAIVSAEFLRDQYLGLTWSSIGYTQWRWLEGVQSAAIFRVHLLSWSVLLANAALAGLILRPRERSSHVGLAVALAVLVVLHVGGALRLTTVLEEGPLAVGVQGNIDQVMKETGSRKKAWEAQHDVFDGRKTGVDPDLLVFAETSFHPVTGQVQLGRLLADPEWGGWLPRGRRQATVLGYNDYSGGKERNVAGVVVEGKQIATYAKRVLVPMGEYIPEWTPFRDWFEGQVQERGGYRPRMEPGDAFVSAPLESGPRSTRFGLNICYEMVFPGEFLGLMREHDPDFVVNISNDGWYGDSNELDLVHIAGRFRAVECGRSLFRVSNTGISTSIDPLGRFRATVNEGAERKGVKGLLVDRVQLLSGTTPWVWGGDILPAILPLALVALAGRSLRRRRAPGFQTQPPSR